MPPFLPLSAFYSRNAEEIAASLPRFAYHLVAIVAGYAEHYSACMWALKIDQESLRIMITACGEFGIRASHPLDFTAVMNRSNARCKNGLRTLIVLGLEGCLTMDRYTTHLLGRDEWPATDLTARPDHRFEQWKARPQTLTSDNSLDQLCDAKFREAIARHKYGSWWKGDVHTLKAIIYCIGEIVREPWNEKRLTVNQEKHINAILNLYQHRAYDDAAKLNLCVLALEDFGLSTAWRAPPL